MDLKDKDGVTALLAAANWDKPEVVKLLVRAGAEVNVTSSGETPLHVAARKGHDAVVTALLRAPSVAVDNRTSIGQTPLWSAVQSEQVEITRLLLQSGANPNARTLGTTPLMIAAYKGNATIVRVLIEWKADPNARGPDATSALSIAQKLKHYRIVEILRSAGAQH